MNPLATTQALYLMPSEGDIPFFFLKTHLQVKIILFLDRLINFKPGIYQGIPSHSPQ